VTGPRVLAAVVALQLVAETALTPYWPALLRTLFGTQELAATGGYLTACRLAGLLALPLWALAARRWPVQRLLVGSLLACAVLDLALALAPTLLLFTVFSAGVVAAGSALVLAYPALVQVAGRADDRLSPVLVGVAVFHAASLLATVIGAGVVALPQPRVGLATFAVVDLLLALLVWRRVPAAPAAVRAVTPRTAPVARPVRLVAPVAVVVALAVLSDTGTSVPRPFFAELVLQSGGTLASAAVLFLLPSLGALLVLPAARLLAARLGGALLPLAALTGAAGLLAQAAAPTALPLVAAGRLGLGAGLGLLAVALDLRLFAAVGTGGPGYAFVETGRSVALLAAPLLATVAATTSLVLPLVVGAALLGATALLAAASHAAQPVTAPQEPARASYA
jgi:hypothetical protein